jgi:hypothetical protein
VFSVLYERVFLLQQIALKLLKASIIGSLILKPSRLPNLIMVAYNIRENMRLMDLIKDV